MALIAPRTARVIDVDDATLAAWAERGVTRIPPDEAAMMRVSDDEAERTRTVQHEIAATEDYGYVPRGPITFADEEPRPRPR